MKIKVKRKLDETSVAANVVGAPVPTKEKKEISEMFSSSGLTGGGCRIRISGDKEYAGWRERADQQGLMNEADNTLSSQPLPPDELSRPSWASVSNGAASASNGALKTTVQDKLGSNLQSLDEKAKKAVQDAGYLFKGYLGGGQFGKVFKVEKKNDGVEQAMKIVMGTPFAIDREVRNYEEVQKARSSSQNIAKHFPETFAAWKQDGFGFIAMEILEPVKYDAEAMVIDRTNILSRDIHDNVYAAEQDPHPEAEKLHKNQSKKAAGWYESGFMKMLSGASSKIESIALQGLPDDPEADYDEILYYVSPTYMKALKAQAETNSPIFLEKFREHYSLFIDHDAVFPNTARLLEIAKEEAPDAPYLAVAFAVIANVIYSIRGSTMQNTTNNIDYANIDDVIFKTLIPFMKGYREYSTMRLGYKVGGPEIAAGEATEKWDRVAKELFDLTGLVPRDVHYGNMMQRPNGDLVIVDLGLFRKETDEKRLFETRTYRIKILR